MYLGGESTTTTCGGMGIHTRRVSLKDGRPLMSCEVYVVDTYVCLRKYNYIPSPSLPLLIEVEPRWTVGDATGPLASVLSLFGPSMTHVVFYPRLP